MKTYHQMIRGRFDKDSCAEALRNLSKDPDNPDNIERVLEESLPVLGCLISTKFRRVLKPDTEEYDEVLSSVPVSFYEYLRSSKFQDKFYDNPDTMFSFLFGMFRYEILNILKRTRRQIDPVSPANFSVTSYFSLEASSSYTEFRIFASEIPEFLTSEVKKKIRFVEGDDNLICKTILHTLVRSDGIPWSLLSYRFKKNKSYFKFYADHVAVCIKMVLQENKEVFDHVPHIMDAEADDDHSKASYEFFTESLHGFGHIEEESYS